MSSFRVNQTNVKLDIKPNRKDICTKNRSHFKPRTKYFDARNYIDCLTMRNYTPYSKAKVISYQDNYVPIPGITLHSRRKKVLKLFLIMISVATILTFFKLNLTNRTKSNNVSVTKTLSHLNPCRHVTPEPEIILQEKFDSNDYFFPYSYKERICATPNKTTTQANELDELQTCFTERYHCITRYKRFQVVRIPFPGNLTSRFWKIERIHVAVACECSRTEIVKIYGT